MAILLVNLGTADLTIKINGYFLPLLDLQVPVQQQHHNPEALEPDDEAAKPVWCDRNNLIKQFITQELGITPQPSKSNQITTNYFKVDFRQATERIWKYYQTDPGQWHQRIKVARFLGVIQNALELTSEQLTCYLFTSNQSSKQHQDTVFAAKILEHWFNQDTSELSPEDKARITLEFKYIPGGLPLARGDEDLILSYYYDQLQTLDRSKTLFISIQGGTAYMKTALKIQAIGAGFKSPIILEPQLNVSRLMTGDTSHCKRLSYWRFQRQQKYENIKQLLNRWDFAGAKTILEDWQGTLNHLASKNLTEDGGLLEKEQAKVERLLIGLDTAVAWLNSDLEAARNSLQKLSPEEAEPFAQYLFDDLRVIYNLYAHLIIHNELKQISDFIGRLGSFYEVSRMKWIEVLDGNEYLKQDGDTGWKQLNVDSVYSKNPRLWDNFVHSHDTAFRQLWPNTSKRNPIKGKDKNVKQHGKKGQTLRFDRLVQRTFLEAIIRTEFKSQNESKQSFLNTLKIWEELDFWYEQRNQITHSAKGVDIQRVEEVYQNRDLTKYPLTAPYDEILDKMREMVTPLLVHYQNDLPEVPFYEELRQWIYQELQLLAT